MMLRDFLSNLFLYSIDKDVFSSPYIINERIFYSKFVLNEAIRLYLLSKIKFP